jgi:predicted nucleotidyltransferase
MKMFETNTLQIEKFCKKNRICKLAFFGSAVRKDFMPNSDIDVLVEFIEGHKPGYQFFAMENELSRLLGRKVDLETVGFLSPKIREHVLSEAVVAYEQA